MEMNTKENQIRIAASNFEGISQQLFSLAAGLEKRPSMNCFPSLDSINRIAEATTVSLRNLVGRVTPEENMTFFEDAAEAMSITVQESDQWLKITLPGIIPHRNARDNPTFLTRPMRHALLAFQREHPIERFADCAICIVHQYDVALGSKRIRDYDNIETKRYLDVIESVFLTNDTGLLCTVLQATAFSDRDATIFYIMPPWRMTEWVQSYLTFHTENQKKADSETGMYI
jgi:hypothetical protein